MGDAFSRTGKCHTFDAKADGYIKAEGVNAVFLKRLKDAIKDGDPIRAVIRGTATNSDGRTPGIANPSTEAQAAAIRAAYANAGITDLTATSYLECHGTGTLVRASRTLLSWPNAVLRRASINSFGFGGSNAHVILEEAKPWAKSRHVSSFNPMDEFDNFFSEDSAASEKDSILVMSANDEKSLLSYAEALGRHLKYPAVRVDIRDLAYTLSERRSYHSHRGFIVTNKASFDPRALISGKKSENNPSVGFVFTGQGAQWPQMGKLLLQNFPIAEKLLHHMDSVLQQTSSPPSWSLIRKFPLNAARKIFN
ncbi:MAG: hypothetical protein Q9160_008488 [Pyrenula sp. 1 TL-2023]